MKQHLGKTGCKWKYQSIIKRLPRHKNKYEQLKIGAYPFVVPQDEDEHKIYGLELIEHETII